MIRKENKYKFFIQIHLFQIWLKYTKSYKFTKFYDRFINVYSIMFVSFTLYLSRYVCTMKIFLFFYIY